jgi:hypothetical protein
MSVTNIFFCTCGNQIGRPRDRREIAFGKKASEPQYAVVPWKAKKHDALLHGIRCSGCSRNWLFSPSKEGIFVEVTQCCTDTLEHRCTCRWE